MRYLMLFLTIGILPHLTHAQGVTDALRYSNQESIGTARSLGAGSALGALGADFSVISTNPAGLAWYRASEFTITPSIFSTKVNTQITSFADNPVSKDSRNNFVLSNFGIVVASQPASPGWKQVNFGIGLNRVADFNQRSFFEGESTGSIVDRFKELANSSAGLDDFEAGLAYNAEALLGPDDNGLYSNDFELAPNALIHREQSINTSGSINELSFALAGNYNDRVLIGMTVGVPFLHYREEKVYTEEDPNTVGEGNVPFFQNLEYDESLTTTGTGINLKLGMAFRITQAVRMGVAFHTPTVFRLEDSYNTSMYYNYTDGGANYQGSAESPDGLFNYKLRTPWRLIGSLGGIIGKAGFLSGEIEWVDYTNAQFRFDGYDTEERDANQNIVKTLNSALNLRVGGEVVYDIFRFRGGFGLHQSPLAGDDTVNNSYSLGIGIRQESFFIDFAYRHYTFKETYVPYLLNDSGSQQFIDRDVLTNRFLMTFGFRF